MERNSLRGPNAATVDMALFKNFPIGSRARFQFRLEAFNVFNRVNYNNPNATITAGANFGRILGAGDPRVLQLGFKFLYLVEPRGGGRPRPAPAFPVVHVSDQW